MALKTVLVGAGKIGASYADDARTARFYREASHAQVLADHPGFEWAAVVDPSAEARGAVRARWGVAGFAHAEELPDRPSYEVAVLATPPGEREAALDALPGLKAVLVEKPLGRDLAEAEAFVALCRRRHLPVAVNYWRRADDTFRDLAAGGLASRIGTPQAVFALYGNGVRNNGSHVIDFLRMLLGEIVAVQAIGEGRPLAGPPLAGDCALAFAAHFSSGLVAAVQSLDFAQYREVGLDLWGSDGRLTIFQEGLALRVFPVRENRAVSDACEIASDEPGSAILSTVGTALRRLYDNFAAALAGHDDLVSDGANALATERIVAAALRSAGQGGAVVRLA